MTSFRRFSATAGLVLTLLVILSGCVQADRNIQLNADGSGIYKETIGLSAQILALGGDQYKQQITDSVTQSAKQTGGQVRTYEANGFDYWEISQSFKNVGTLNTLLTQQPGSTGTAPTPTSNNEKFLVTKSDSFFSTTFHVTGNMDFTIDSSQFPTTGNTADLFKDAKE